MATSPEEVDDAHIHLHGKLYHGVSAVTGGEIELHRMPSALYGWGFVHNRRCDLRGNLVIAF